MNKIKYWFIAVIIIAVMCVVDFIVDNDVMRFIKNFVIIFIVINYFSDSLYKEKFSSHRIVLFYLLYLLVALLVVMIVEGVTTMIMIGLSS